MLHYSPSDLDAMTVDQFDRACRWVDSYIAEMKKQSRG